jgi:hypothetical protein
MIVTVTATVIGTATAGGAARGRPKDVSSRRLPIEDATIETVIATANGTETGMNATAIVNATVSAAGLLHTP